MMKSKQVTLIPGEYFNEQTFPGGVPILDFRASFTNREDAISYARQHNCDFVRATEDEMFDVLSVPAKGR